MWLMDDDVLEKQIQFNVLFITYILNGNLCKSFKISNLKLVLVQAAKLDD